MTNAMMKRQRRLRGLVLIVNTLLPGVVVVTLVVGTAWTAHQVRRPLARYRAAVDSIVQSATTARDSIAVVIDSVAARAPDIKAAGEAMVARANAASAAVSRAVSDVRGSVNAAVDAIPVPETRRLPWKADLKAAFSVFSRPFDRVRGQFRAIGRDLRAIQAEMAAVMGEIKRLSALREYLAGAVRQYETLRSELDVMLGTLAAVVRVVLVLGALLVLWTILNYGFWILGRLMTALALLRGEARAA